MLSLQKCTCTHSHSRTHANSRTPLRENSTLMRCSALKSVTSASAERGKQEDDVFLPPLTGARCVNAVYSLCVSMCERVSSVVRLVSHTGHYNGRMAQATVHFAVMEVDFPPIQWEEVNSEWHTFPKMSGITMFLACSSVYWGKVDNVSMLPVILCDLHQRVTNQNVPFREMQPDEPAVESGTLREATGTMRSLALWQMHLI